MYGLYRSPYGSPFTRISSMGRSSRPLTDAGNMMRYGAQKTKRTKGKGRCGPCPPHSSHFLSSCPWVVCVPLIESSQNKVLRSDRNESRASLLTLQLGGQGSLESYGERRLDGLKILTKEMRL